MLQNSQAGGEPKWLHKLRASAFDAFETLPVERSELFRKYSSIGEIGWGKLELAIASSEKIPAIKVDAAIIEPIQEAISSHPEILREYLEGKVTRPDESKFVALGNAIFSSGHFIHIPDGTHLKNPISISMPLLGKNTLSATRNVIILGENSSATIIEDNYSDLAGDEASAYCTVSDFHLDDGANLTFGSINSLGQNSTLVSHKKVLLEKDAKCNFSGGFLGGALTISSLENVMQGSGSSAEDFEIIFGSDSQKFSITSDLTHVGQDTKGKVAAKGVFRDASRGLFKGMVKIGKDAKNASSFLAGHSVLLGKNSASDTIPGLQIENNDVKATHSASVAQIDSAQLFYLESRGIPEEHAKKMIVEGFMAPVIRQMRLRDVEIRLKALFELKWERRGMGELKAKMAEIESEMPPEALGSKDIFEGHYKYR